ncbi:Two-component response regulator ARR14 [Zostera marina]|uniref:Two-component response regulator ARR14 n=1 Tax=Zostera marina TaxID=29655 RepID=A0A0K9P4A3_ZOSMR|nr:Two-component response regulator ARR14 [Zostera marina]
MESLEGLRVLVVDDDVVSLKIAGKMLRSCKYIECIDANEALNLLRSHLNCFDLVITDITMTGINDFQLLESILQENNDLPVVMMSVDDKIETMIKSIQKGAYFYLTKPLKMELLMTLWQFVMVKNREKSIGRRDNISQNSMTPSLIDQSSRKGKNIMKTHGKQPIKENKKNSKEIKPVVVWDSYLHDKFIEAIQIIGPHRAVPKNILEKMNVPGLTRENVASHLQKFRLYLKKRMEKNFHGTLGDNHGFSNPTQFVSMETPPQMAQQHMTTPITQVNSFETYYESWAKNQQMFNAHNSSSLPVVPPNIRIELSQPVIGMNCNHMGTGNAGEGNNQSDIEMEDD